MKQAESKTKKLTFGNILLIILIIGTCIVAGLMYKLYEELTQTPVKTAQMHEQQQKRIEVMSPDAKPGDQIVYRDSSAPAQKPATATQATKPTPASAVAPAVAQQLPETDALPAAMPAPRKTTSKKVTTQPKTEKVVKTDDDSINGEVPLRPTNVTKTTPAPSSAGLEKGERPLKPKNTGKSQDAIDELF